MSEALQPIPELVQRAREYFANGDAVQAEQTIMAALREAPASIEALLTFAEIAQFRGQQERAVIAVEQAIGYRPDEAGLWRRLAELYAEGLQWRPADRAYAQAVKLDPLDVQSLVGLGIARLAAQKIAAAITTRDQLLARFPTSCEAHLYAGDLAKALGSVEVAVAAYQRTLELSPQNTDALARLVDLSPPLVTDTLATQVDKAADRADLSDAHRANAEFAQARIQERVGRFDAAFDRFKSANDRQERALCTRGVVYDSTQSEARVTAITARYDAASFRTRIDPAPINLRSIFIVGMPRSGTSLIEQILGTHASVCAGGELPAAQLCEARYLGQRAKLGLAWPANAGNAAESHLLREMQERYLEYLFESDLDGDYVTDKLPGNFMSLGFIRMMLPNAVIVHCTRNPVATCWSLYSANLGHHSPAYTSLANLAHSYRLYRSAMSHWKSVLDPPLVEVEYESLIANPESVIRRLLFECGLPWDAGCLHFHANPRAVTTASALQIRKPIYDSSLRKWENYQSRLAPLLALQ